jgi:general stress protein YciG
MSTATNEVSDTKTPEKVQQVSASPAPSAVATLEQELQPDAPPPAVETQPKVRRPRGFAAIDRKLLAEIASKGGKAAHSAGTAHEFTSAEAREAGRKGGLATHARRRKPAE